MEIESLIQLSKSRIFRFLTRIIGDRAYWVYNWQVQVLPDRVRGHSFIRITYLPTSRNCSLKCSSLSNCVSDNMIKVALVTKWCSCGCFRLSFFTKKLLLFCITSTSFYSIMLAQRHKSYPTVIPTANRFLQHKWDENNYQFHRDRIHKIKPTGILGFKPQFSTANVARKKGSGLNNDSLHRQFTK